MIVSNFSISMKCSQSVFCFVLFLCFLFRFVLFVLFVCLFVCLFFVFVFFFCFFLGGGGGGVAFVCLSNVLVPWRNLPACGCGGISYHLSINYFCPFCP